MYNQRTALSEARSFGGYWARIHASHSINELLPQCETSDLWRIFRKHLPRGRSLEAGCGVGHWVAFLRTHGYNVEGVEYRDEAVRAALQHDPALPIRVGDVRTLDVEDGAYDAYISLGVIEHFEDGPEELLAEARRVTKGANEGARLLISTPLHTPLTEKAAKRRELQEGVGKNGKVTSEERFFEYLFTQTELRSLLERHGLRVIAMDYYDNYSSLSLLLPKLYQRASQQGITALPAKAIARGLLDFAPAPLVAHMQMAICVKA